MTGWFLSVRLQRGIGWVIASGEWCLSKRRSAMLTAVEAGDLEQAKKWGAIRDAFEESGVLAQDALAMPEVAKLQRKLDVAREKLAAAYEQVVAELTKQERL